MSKTKREFVEARCSSKNCTKTHQVLAIDGVVAQTAYCPPSIKHRGYRAMKPGEAQVLSRVKPA